MVGLSCCSTLGHGDAAASPYHENDAGASLTEREKSNAHKTGSLEKSGGLFVWRGSDRNPTARIRKQIESTKEAESDPDVAGKFFL